MARRVDEIERVGFTVSGLIGQADGARLDGDAALALKIHIVKDLLGHFALLHRAAQLDEPVGQRGFAVVDVRDDGKIPDMALVDHRGYSSKIESVRALQLRGKGAKLLCQRVQPRRGVAVRLVRPAQQIVRRNAVVFARPADEVQPRLARAVFIVREQRLRYAEIRRRRALRGALFAPQLGHGFRKPSCHGADRSFALITFCIITGEFRVCKG